MQYDIPELTDGWDKTFPRCILVSHRKAVFCNRFGIRLAADVYAPLRASGPLPAVAVCGPFGAVKEQAAGLYAQSLAVRGFLTVAFDPSYTGESGGLPRCVASPDLNVEDLCAAVDFLSIQPNVDHARICVLGIGGWGGMALAAAALDPRIRAAVTSSMCDMTRQITNGLFEAEDSEQDRLEKRRKLAAQRTSDFALGTCARGGGIADPLPPDAPDFLRDYHDYFKTPRGYHPRAPLSGSGWCETAQLSFLGADLLRSIAEIRAAVLMIHGEKAHSCYFTRSAYALLRGENKQLLLIPDAVHTDLYDRTDIIPFDTIERFLRSSIK